MGDIRILSENVVNQIAAGEVVERAASVLKELVENALDAGAKRIQIVVKGQGRELIQVVDDGCGMSRGDLHLAFERHATSKLSRAEDLQAVSTLGFRGEALPSIASVSYVEVRSCTGSTGKGTMLRLEGGTITHEEPVAAPRGTSISVHSLFFNTPARARFLKSGATELAHIVRIFRQYALAYPEISWNFAHDETLEYSLPSSSLLIRLEDLLGAGFSGKVLPLDLTLNGIKIGGVIGKTELNKKSRGDQYFFLNRRPIQSTLLHSAVKAAMREQLEDGEWPFYIVQLYILPADVDVNVHPAKLEVRFADEKLVHAALYRAVRAVLPSQIIQEPMAQQAFSASPGRQESGADGIAEANMGLPGMTAPEFAFSAIPTDDAGASTAAEWKDRSGQDTLYRPTIFQVHGRYLISQIRSGIAVIDQHAAHERILYEKAQRSFSERMFNSQQLLFPILLELEPEEDAIYLELHDDLEKFGFQIREFGVRTYSIEAVPAGLKRVSEARIIHEMITEYQEFRRAQFQARDALAASFACKAAIRTGDSLTAEEMTALVDELFATKFPLTCPHGRPTVIHIKLSELDRRFKRTE
ncbi:DNA mismatch repair endonuclease MutL [candidate division KSB1 bacterium]|nr:MAG: DNA mismatch repair endonuclease MutL [candidate division KSB1 bacterium]